MIRLLLLGAILSSAVAQQLQFRDIAKSAGVTVVTTSGKPDKTSAIEVNGSGLCWLDFDNDGFMDLLVVNGGTVDDLRPGAPTPATRNYLYRNNGGGAFTDVTAKAGITQRRWGSGCTAADYDNDGFIDLFLPNLGGSFLYRNQGDGTFREVAQSAGVSGGFDWRTGAAFGDIDNDGYLDLYVSGYLELRQMLAPQKQCPWRGMMVFCGPGGLKGAPDRLYRNNRNGTFTDITAQSGIQDRDLLFGFTATFEDFDNDGKADLFVANDRGRNYLFHNLGGAKFEEVAETWAIAYPAEGSAQANMGVAVGDYDRDGTMDVFVTTFSQDHYMLYHNTGKGLFLDVSGETGLASATRPYLGWGTFFADLDNDSWLELFTANGHVYPQAEKAAGVRESYLQRPLLFRQSVPGIFTEIGGKSGLAAVPVHSSRGAAYADIDNDGRLDIVYSNMEAAPTLLHNVSTTLHHWLTLKLVGVQSNRQAIGARVKLTAGGVTQHASVRAGESYLSTNDPRIHFGLGANTRTETLEIRWPSGKLDHVSNPPIDRIVVVREGQGIIAR